MQFISYIIYIEYLHYVIVYTSFFMSNRISVDLKAIRIKVYSKVTDDRNLEDDFNVALAYLK